VDTLLIDLFGATDNLYTREAIRKTLVGAVARVMQPACKFDLVLTLVSQQQGTGKSSFFKALGREWFSDTFMTVQGKEALEQIQGAWIIEMAELAGTRKADVEAVKHFVTKQVDQFRPAYARASETYERQCIFVATTNQRTFLKDATGNRRFLPIDLQPLKVQDNLPLRLFLDSPSEVDQVWAEAFALWREGEQPFLSEEAERIAEEEQRGHSETDERTGIIEAYLAKELPTNWHTLDLFARRLYLSNETPYSGTTLPRREVCIAEIWCECLDKPKEDMDQYKTRDLNSIMKSLEGWEQSASTKTFPIYGKQRFYFKAYGERI
jgi:putative DNA primase/helicase